MAQVSQSVEASCVSFVMDGPKTIVLVNALGLDPVTWGVLKTARDVLDYSQDRFGRSTNRQSNPLISATSAQIARHRFINLLIRWRFIDGE
jgi:hypothetical protein